MIMSTNNSRIAGQQHSSPTTTMRSLAVASSGDILYTLMRCFIIEMVMGSRSRSVHYSSHHLHLICREPPDDKKNSGANIYTCLRQDSAWAIRIWALLTGLLLFVRLLNPADAAAASGITSALQVGWPSGSACASLAASRSHSISYRLLLQH